MNSKYSERELITGLQNHERIFFDYLYDQYAGALNGIICRIIKDPQLSEEVLQQTFIKIWHLIKSYDNTRERLFTWMVGIAKLQAVNSIRNNTNENHSDCLNSKALNDSMNRNCTASESHSFTTATQVNYFENHSQQILSLAYFENCRPEDISKNSGIPLETIKTILRTAVMEAVVVMPTNRL